MAAKSKKVSRSKIEDVQSKKSAKLVEKLTKELIGHLKIEAKAKVSEKDEVIHVQFETDNPGILIGYHGETLSSLQLMLAMMVYRKTGEWTRILINVGDYRERRQESLERMALSAAQKVKFSGESQALPPMSSAERRIVHLALAEDPEVETISEGEGRDRRVIIKPRK